ncbi:MAG: DUF1501 domain-containing protein [Bryobacteraceae bacterium]
MRTRREFIRKCCGLAAAGAASHVTRLGLVNAAAQSTGGYKALVCVFLFGGNDNNNTVVPLGTTPAFADYQRMRGTLALPANTLLPVGASYGLHPRLTMLQTQFTRNKLAVVLNVGSLVRPVTRDQIRQGQAQLPRNLYSHSDQVSQWQSSNPSGASATGWGGRVHDVIGSVGSTTFPAGVSLNGNALQLVGQTARAVNLSPGSNFGLDTFGSASTARLAAMQQILTFDSGVQMIGSANGIMASALRGAQEINAALNSAAPLVTQFPNSGIGGQLEQVARVMRARTALGMTRQLFFCGMGGYDTHSDLLPSQDDLFTTLNAALTSFQAALEEMAIVDSVVTFTESEFGRTGNPSTSVGSDHAWGSHHFAFGGPVTGGMYGRFPTLALQGPDDAGDRGLWIPTTAIDQYAATLAAWYGVPDAQLSTIFPNLANFTTPRLGFV